MEQYLAVDREVHSAENVLLSGNYISKVYEGPFKDKVIWKQEFAKFTAGKTLKTGEQYTWYTTCPRCAKMHRNYYVVNLAEVIQ